MPSSALLDSSSSPFSCLKPVPINAVKFTHGFWNERLQIIKHVTIQTQFEMLEKTGRLDNFRRLHTKTHLPFRGYFYNDSDVYKWLEGACWSLATGLDETLQHRIDEVIDIISTSQGRDGYLNTYFSGEHSGERWTNLGDKHELYCAGHLIQAAVAHHRVTTQDKLLMIAVKQADNICKRFLDTDLPATPGHPEIEMALVELYRVTGDIRYLNMAQSFLNQRGYGVIGGQKYHLDHVPFREMKQLMGHAVRAMYLCCGVADIYLETGEKILLDTLTNLWTRMVSKQMYVTGGIGSRHQGEAFGNDYELPNDRAYAETCAAIGSMMWNWRMLHIDPDVKYADLIEWTLYNAILPGMGLNGKEYHYENPLAVYEKHLRQPWFDCACCPTNILRLLSSFGNYLYSHSNNSIWIHQYASNISEIQINDDLSIKLSIETDYPWDGCVQIKLLSFTEASAGNELNQLMNNPISFVINLRIPAWIQTDVPIYINGNRWGVPGLPGSYLKIEREWVVEDKIDFNFPLNTYFLACHPFVPENSNRIALSRGPLVYCIEEDDNQNIDPRHVHVKLDGNYKIQPININSQDTAGIEIDAMITSIGNDWETDLYRKIKTPTSLQKVRNQDVTAIPYFAWGNRTHGWMQVWLSC